MKGEKSRIHEYLHKKKITITIINNVDKRMLTKFLRSKWNYWPKPSSKKWIADNYITDRKVISAIGYKLWSSLSLQERVELKAELILRQYVWKMFHLFNKQFVKRWKIKYAEDTDFKIEISTKNESDTVPEAQDPR